MIFVDSHCHIDGEQFDADRLEVIARANAAGVETLLVIGTGSATDLENFSRVVRLAESNSGIYCAIGVHPHDAKSLGSVEEKNLIELARSSEKIIAWGEIGLDFYYDHSPRDVQKDVFVRQIRIARTLDLPIIVHSRDADAETLEIISDECKYPDFRGGIMHCFGGTPEMAVKLMKMGFLISFAGNVTFKKAENLRLSAKAVPIDKLLIETDCPYLAPEPFRGRRNEPKHVVETARFLAGLYGVNIEVLAQKTTSNFQNFFQL